MDWTKYTTDPLDKTIGYKMRDHLQSIRRIKHISYENWLLAQVENKSVLDIGAIEHDLSYTEMPSWKHRMLVEKASKVVGVDILEDYAKILNERGYDIRVCDATSDAYLGEKFDVVVLGDVIEHVSNPVGLIKFSIRHLSDHGEIYAKTPNPYYIDKIRWLFNKNKGFENFEHIAAYTPTMALEVARRAGCELDSYIVFPRKRPWKYMFPKSDIFTRDFVYVFKHKKSA